MLRLLALRRTLCASLAGGGILVAAWSAPAAAAEHDLQQWTQLFFRHSFDDTFSFELVNRYQFDQDISRLQVLVVSPRLRAKIAHGFSLGLGYTYIEVEGGQDAIVDEHQVLQTLGHRFSIGSLGVGNRLQLEQRIIEDPSEVIVRLRYRLGLTLPLSDKWYVTGSNEVFVNFNDKETGPLDGFERNWLRGLVGYRVSRHLKLEFGYHWTYLRRRGIPDLNQHALMLNIPISTR